MGRIGMTQGMNTAILGHPGRLFGLGIDFLQTGGG